MKRFLLFFIAIFSYITSFAANEASIYVTKELQGKPGDIVSVPVAMKNNFGIPGFQFWLGLPEGISFNMKLNEDAEMDYDVVYVDRNKSRHVLSLIKNVEGGLQVMGYASDGMQLFKGEDGDIVSVQLKIDEKATPGEYKLRFSNVAFSDVNAVSYEQNDFVVNLTVYQDYNITATSANETMGTVTGGGNYRNGTKATLTATPNEGYHFVKWSNDVTENPYTFAVDKDLALTATFDAKEYNLIYMVDGVEYKKVPVKFGSTITPEAFPTKVGYTFSGWGEIPATMPTSDVTVNGTFAINKYTFTFDADGGSEVAGITQDYNSAITAPTAPTKTGYTFAGWVPAIPETVPAENMSFKAQWTINQYTLTFDADNGTEATVITQDFNTKFETPAAPTKTGYTFAGWDSEVPETIPAENKSFKALWTINQYTFSFDADGGSDVAAITQNYGTKIETPAAPTKTGYTFAGWVPAIPETVPAENMSFKAQWTINQYTLTFDADNGTEATVITQDFNTKFETPAAPTKTGYTFAGWDSEVPETIPAENKSFKALWTINQYTFSFDADGGSDVAAITQDYGTKIETPTAPTKPGYTFAGWVPAIPETVPAENMSFKAQWTINQYTLTFDADNGTEATVITQDFGTKFETPAAPTKTGYTFAGWDSEVPETIPAENKSFKALWTINQYTFSFDADGGSDVAAITQNYGTKIESPTAPTKTGYTFAGWVPAIPETVPAENMSFKAQWTINQYSLTFNADNGTEATVITQDYGTKFDTPADPTREGYTFAGWDMDIPETIPAENMSFTAKWIANQYTLTFDSDGGSDVAAITQDYGTKIETPAAPTKTGYTFAGWDNEIPETMPAESMSFKAQWTINQYTLTFNADNGTEDVEITQDYGTKFETPADPTREGYTFAGWDMDIPETIPAENMSFTAKWIANQYTLTFDSDGGSDVAAITQDYGTKIETPAAPTKTGYTFAGWDNEIPETMPAESMSFKAQWTINQYTLTFNADNGTEDVEITQDYGTKFETPADPTREGYTFAGWDMDIPETIPAEDMSFTALWSVNSYKLVYILDGEVYAEYDVEYGSEITPENDPEKTGYTFDGWTEIPETMPAHDVEIYGSFSVVTAIRTILADEKAVDVYNLNGVLVKRNVEVDKLDKVLKKGVYIICGKKFVVK